MSFEYANHPLPPQWEQKYDSESKRFFFIDHSKKITTWIDPRIDLCKHDHQAPAPSKNAFVTVPPAPSKDAFVLMPPANGVTSREKKAKAIHKKFPKMTLDKITKLLDENYDNVSSVEGVLQREQQVAEQLEQEETSKRIADELQKKAEKEERENRIKDANNQKVQQNAKRKMEEEAKKIEMKEDLKNKTKTEASTSSDETNNQRTVVDNPNVEDDSTKIESTNIIRDDDKSDISSSMVINAKESKDRLNKGPNKAIYSGANPRNQSGPNHELLTSNRSILAKGPDPANRFGPRSDLRIKMSN